MSGSVLSSIIQDCKAHNKCFTSSPQDATPVQGLHSSKQTVGLKDLTGGAIGKYMYFKAYRGGIGNAGSYSS